MKNALRVLRSNRKMIIGGIFGLLMLMPIFVVKWASTAASNDMSSPDHSVIQANLQGDKDIRITDGNFEYGGRQLHSVVTGNGADFAFPARTVHIATNETEKAA